MFAQFLHNSSLFEPFRVLFANYQGRSVVLGGSCAELLGALV